MTRAPGARKTCKAHYPYMCCSICGLSMEAVLDVAHLDQDPSNNNPDNLAWLCKTHHRMFDCGLYPVGGIKMLQDHWQQWHANGAVADHSIYMKDAGIKAARTRKRKIAAKKAVATRMAATKVMPEKNDEI